MKITISEKAEKLKWSQTQTLKRFPATLDEYPPFSVLAVDPGVNFGITTISDGEVWVYHGKLARREPGSEASLEYAWEALSLISSLLFMVSRQSIQIVIEGAAYHKAFGQVGLADVRAGFYLGARQIVGALGSIHVVAPMAARKKVLGNGKAEPWVELPTLNHNAVDSVVLAAWAVGTPLRAEIAGS